MSEVGRRGPRVSIATSFDYCVPIEEQIPLIAEAGFTDVSLGAREGHSGYLSRQRRARLASLVRASGLAIDTIHGPRLDEPNSVETLSAVASAAAELGAPVIVVHVSPFDFPAAELPSRQAALLRTCVALEPLLKELGVHFALENVLPGIATDLVCCALDRLDPGLFGFCYDSSHDQIGGPRAFTLLHRLRERLIAVQLSDRIRDFVDHVLPGEGFIHWRELCAELRCTAFHGPLLLEVATTHSLEKEARPFVLRAYRAACQLAEWIS